MPVSIGHNATISAVESHRDALLEELRIHAAVEVDCSDIVDADLSFIQVMNSAWKFAEREGREIRLSPDASPALRALIARTRILAADAQAWGLPSPDGAPGQ